MSKPAKDAGVGRTRASVPEHQEPLDRRHTGWTVPDVATPLHINHTPFPSQYFQSVNQQGDVFHVIALRVTYDMCSLRADGSLDYAEHQTPLAVKDVWSGKVGDSCPLWESDYAPYKPRCDVLVANAISRPPPSEWHQVVGRHLDPRPQPRSAARWNCGIALRWIDDAGQVRQWHKQLTVTGPRRWGLMGLGAPEPAHEVAITWENAFGGTHLDPPEDVLARDGSVKTEAGTWLDRRDARNPVGMGINKDMGQPGPQLETSALNPYHGGVTQGRYPPVSLTPLARHWEPRIALAGTYDDAWLQEQWPLPPMDLNYAYWNCAPKDQQTDYLPPGTAIHLMNLFPESIANADGRPWPDEWSIALPAHQFFHLAYHTDVSGRGLRIQPHLDTLTVDMGCQQVCATYRLVQRASSDSASLVFETRMAPVGQPDKSVNPAELGPLA